MRITVEIDAQQLASLQKETGSRTKSKAVRCAVGSYLDGLARRRLLRKVLDGDTDYTLTNDEVEVLGTYDPNAPQLRPPEGGTTNPEASDGGPVRSPAFMRSWASSS